MFGRKMQLDVACSVSLVETFSRDYVISRVVRQAHVVDVDIVRH